ncbi:hypothetical protein OJF2_66550 [Aquisphaera giovannonii]|uniref:DUF4398 domain-containing protein n=1 Tax=Aquisphaera giovannonii TaxID=406548 RepID=A0A5B9WCU7_9BACT|nr:hypothetical protein [Aquisphaera giovannonii]QEH38059.1 hypothetical protein OJF2_66550 [Aquisphaera giovannonii]
MRPSTTALTTTILGAALAAQTVSAQQSSPPSSWRRDGNRATATASEPSPSSQPISAAADEQDPTINMAASRGARYLMRNGIDYINYQEYERALKFLREAENRQRELSEPEKRTLKQAIERAQRGLREAVGAESPYAVSQRPRRTGGFAPARTTSQLARVRMPDVPGEKAPATASLAQGAEQGKARTPSREGDDRGDPIRLAGAEVVDATPGGAPSPAGPEASAEPAATAGPGDQPAMLPLADETPDPAKMPPTYRAIRRATSFDDAPAVAGSGTITPPAGPQHATAAAAGQPVAEPVAAAEPAAGLPPVSDDAPAVAGSGTITPPPARLEATAPAEPAALASPDVGEPSRLGAEAMPQLDPKADGPAGPQVAAESPAPVANADREYAKPKADAGATPAAAPAPVGGPAPAAIDLEPPSDPAPKAADASPATDREELPALPLNDPGRPEPKPDAGPASSPAAASAPADFPAPPAAGTATPAGDDLPQLPLQGASEDARQPAPRAEAPAAPKPEAEAAKAEAPKAEPVPAVAAAVDDLPATPSSAPGRGDGASQAEALPPPAAEVAASPAPAAEPVPAAEPAAKPEAVPSPSGPARGDDPAAAPSAVEPGATMPDSGAGLGGAASPLGLPSAEAPKSTLLPEQQRRIEEIARRQDEEMRRNPIRPGQPAPGNRDTDLPASDARNQTVTQIDISRAPSPAEARPIRAIPVPDDFVPLGKREWSPQRKMWAAAATCHLPLYFQDPMLERYGHSAETYFGRAGRFLTYPVDDPRQTTQRNQLIQPAFSSALFAWQILTLPYALVVDPPWEAQYDLGYWRPGDKIPTDLYYQPLYGTGPPLRGKNY